MLRRLGCVVCAAVSAAWVAKPWSWPRGLPADVVFVKGKKVAGTTVGGIVRRLGNKYGIAFFSPKVPSRSTAAWRAGGREHWILEQFAEFVAATAEGSYVGWAQEQTLSPRKQGLQQTSSALADLARRAWRVTVIREPYAHALSACTHFGPCAVKTVGNKRFANTTSAARAAWVDSSLGPAQMWRFITPEPGRLPEALGSDAAAKRAAVRSAVDYYHAVLLADDLETSLVALALSLPGLALSDVLHVPAKTTHTERRPAVEQQPEDFVNHLRGVFYAGATPGAQSSTYERLPNLAPDTELYLAARARLRATVETVGAVRFDADLARYRKMQSRMLAACSNPGRNKRRRDNASLAPLPRGLSPRAAHECLYGDQGCGYRCIQAWAYGRDRRLEARRNATRFPSDYPRHVS